MVSSRFKRMSISHRNDVAIAHGSSLRRVKSRRKTVFGLWIALLVESLLLMALAIRLSIALREVNTLTIVEHKQARQLAEIEPELNKMRQEIADLTLSRLPALKKLDYDTVIPIEQYYVKNIVFTLSGRGEQKNYEYKLVMNNRELTAVHPTVKILFFDRVGIQVGLSQIGVDKEGVPTLDVLERGEIKSYSSSITLAEDAKPEYFFVQVKKP
jgi:hypothetical protein